MKSVLISIQPKWCELIANGKKTVEVRKTKPKLETPFKVYIYCTNNKDMLWILKESERESRRKITSIFTAKDVGGAIKANGKVIGEFVCDRIDRIAHCGTCNRDIRLRLVDENLSCKELNYEYLNNCKLSYSDIDKYSNGCDVFGWHISNLVIYDEPRELRDFHKYGVCPCGAKPILHCTENMSFCAKRNLTRPPQSWCYVSDTGINTSKGEN